LLKRPAAGRHLPDCCQGEYFFDAVVGYVDGFALRIGARATLHRSAGDRAYGVMMNLSPDATNELYADSSVVDYVPEPVTVALADGSKVEAVCYNLAVDKVAGTNKNYQAV
jgi:hypothetical protein